MRTRGKSELLLMLAQVVCSAGEACVYLREQSRNRQFVRLGPSIDHSTWLSFYVNPYRITTRLLHHFLPKKKIGGPKKHRLSSWLLLTFAGWQIISCTPADWWKKEFEKLTPEEKQGLNREFKNSYELFGQHWPEAQGMLKRLSADDESDYGPGEIMPRRIFQVPEVVFAFQVLIPCLLEYQRNAYELFQQAREGDWEAIQLLLRVDKRVMHDPEIGARISDECQRCQLRQDAIATAYSSPPNSKLHRMTMKIGLAAYLRVVSQEWKQRLTFREIRRLMDAYARKDGKNCDEDLPMSDEAFDQGVKRAVKKLKLEKWDIFSWIKCPDFAPEQPLSSGHEKEPQDQPTEAA